VGGLVEDTGRQQISKEFGEGYEKQLLARCLEDLVYMLPDEAVHQSKPPAGSLTAAPAAAKQPAFWHAFMARASRASWRPLGRLDWCTASSGSMYTRSSRHLASSCFS